MTGRDRKGPAPKPGDPGPMPKSPPTRPRAPTPRDFLAPMLDETPRGRFRIWLTEYLDASWARGRGAPEVAETVRRQGVLAGLTEAEILEDFYRYAEKVGGIVR